MIADFEYALLAGAAYTSTRSTVNLIREPQGWLPYWPSGLYAALLDMGFKIEANSILYGISGFEARVFSNGTEAVIAYGGTNPLSLDLLTDVKLALGVYDVQLERAALVYAAVKQASNQPVSLTGHSLGGGLAALIGVYFNKTAVTFDQAPFLLAALADHRSELQSALSRWGFGPDGDLSGYFARASLDGVDIRGADGVSSLAVEGELLSVAPIPYHLRIGRPTEFFDLDDAAVAGTSRIDLHAQSLLILVQHSGTFVERMRDIPTLLPSLFEDRYFDRGVKDPEETAILEQFIRHEFGVPGQPYAAGDGLFTSFVNELTILTEPGVVQQTLLDEGGQPQKQFQFALMLVLQQHYFGIRGAFDPSQTLFKATEGGWYFDVASLPIVATSADLLAGRLLTETVGFMYDGGATKFASPALSKFDRLTWQSGDGPFNVTGTVKVDLMLGGVGGDSLNGAGGDDLLLGGAGADTLDGGAGNDTLIGGAGADHYKFSGDFGHDTIEDSDGAGQIKVDDNPLPAGKRHPELPNTWVSDNGAWTYVFVPPAPGGSGGTLYILKTAAPGSSDTVSTLKTTAPGSSDANTITVNKYTLGQLGITLSPEQATPPPVASTFTGDFVKKLDDSGTWYLRDGLNYVLDPQGGPGPQPDVFLGTAEADRFELGGGNDAAGGGGSEDVLLGGDGDDLLLGGGELDLLLGGPGNDFLFGSHYGTNWQLPSGPGLPPTPAAGPERSRGFGWVIYDQAGPDGNGRVGWTLAGVDMNLLSVDAGNLLDGGAGNDWIFAGSGDDVAFGGAGNDELRGMGGADLLLGEDGDDVLLGDGVVLAGYLESTPANKHGSDELDGGAGNDTLIGQGGADFLFGGAGNDLLWGDDGSTVDTPVEVHGEDLLDGGDGNDQLIGGGGADELYGGADNDLLIGDDNVGTLPVEYHGDDILDGEGGSDTLVGYGGDDILYGGDDDDTLIGDASPSQLAGSFHGSDLLDGGGGNDMLEGGGGADVLSGGDGADMLWGDSPQPGLAAADLGEDSLDGGDGDDTLVGGGKDDTLFGGTGDDQLRGDGAPANSDPAASGADYLEGEDGDDLLWGDGGDDIIYGGADDDELLGDAPDVPAQFHGDDFLDGEDGDDILVGGGGDDVLYGGAGVDYMFGDSNDGTLEHSAHGADDLRGGAGNDVVFGDGGGDSLTGGDGDDYLRGDAVEARVPGSAHGADTLFGDSGNDTLLGDGGDDVLDGGDGADVLLGDAALNELPGAYHGRDEIDGGDGDDYLEGGGRDDVLRGGAGNDMLWGDAAGPELAAGELGNDTLDGGDGDDTAFGGGGNDIVRGGAGQDWLRGDGGPDDADPLTHGNDTLFGDDGNDSMSGDGGNDVLYGGVGDDYIEGDASDVAALDQGNDELHGDAGNDFLVGGNGSDTYVFNRGDGADTIDNLDVGGGVDTLRFGPGVSPDDVSGTRVGSSLRLRIDGTADAVTIVDWYLADSLDGAGRAVTHKLDRVEFEGGVVWTTAMVELSLTDPLVLQGGPGPDVLIGGAGDDTLYGGGGDDRLSGGRGNDTLDGGPGADLLEGGTGDDLYLVESATDAVVETLAAGGGFADVVEANFSYTLPKGVENLRMNPLTAGAGFTATGNALGNSFSFPAAGSYSTPVTIYGLAGNDSLIGGLGGDLLSGGSGNDRLDGNAGADDMAGGTGDDEYFVDSAGDRVTEAAGEGYDTVSSFISYLLPANVEGLFLYGAASASLSGTGNSLDNILWGTAGSLVLTGGKGNDYVEGWDGNATYVFNKGDGHDVISNRNAATDTDRLQLGTGITPADVTFQRVENGLLMSMSGGADTVYFSFWFEEAYGRWDVDTIQFSSGTTWTAAQVNAMVGATLTNHAPQLLLTEPVSVTAYEGQEVTFAFPQGVVVDNDPWDAPALVFYMMPAQGDISSIGGLDLAELGRDGTTSNGLFGFVGTPNYGRAGTYEFRAEWRDIFDLTASVPVTITILPASPNRAPELVGAVQDLSIPETAGAASLGPISTLISDPDGDVLAIAVTRSDGSALPSWLTVGPVTPGSVDWQVRVDAGHVEGDTTVPLRIVASDDSGARSDPLTFTVSVIVQDLVLNGTGAADTLSGGSGNDRLVGAAGNDTLRGYAGNDLLDGGAGADKMYGGPGDDTYVVDSTSDVVDETSLGVEGSGRDLVLGSVTYALPAGIEDLTLSGNNAISGTGNALENVLTGNGAVNTLTGGDGNDVLNGGAGADTLVGGPGDDRYVVDNASDKVTEVAGQGIDTVESTVTFSLASYGAVEHLMLAGTAAINGTGNALDNTITGNAAANVLTGGAGADTLAGGAGDDTYVVDSVLDVVVEQAGEGTDLVQSSVTLTLGAHVENLTLTGTAVIDGIGNALDNVLTGNSANNRLVGDAGNDVLDGGSGNDTLEGGLGDDTYVVNVTTDVVIELPGEGVDTVRSAVAWMLKDNLENLVLTGTGNIAGTGNALDNVVTGNAGANTLRGEGGSDILDGGAGNDTMVGGAGDDDYVVDATGDVVTEAAGEGVDTVEARINYTLPANVERLVLGGSGAINGTGNALANEIIGNAAANVLSGGGGADVLRGGAGDDTYVVDSLDDAVIEVAGEGVDLVQSSVAWTLGAHLEKLTLTGSSAIDGTGNALDNVLTGNSGANRLSGGAGNDTYIVGAGDAVVELAGEGTDLVQSSATWVLSEQVENLTLTGSAAIDGTGNALDNVLTGNGAVNKLSGGAGNDWLDGGAGNDLLSGGPGDDTYVVDSASDQVSELAFEGVDTVRSNVAWSLKDQVENLVLTGTAKVNGTGNALDNILVGNSAANTLTGGAGNDVLDGGAGADALIGGAGDDTYVVDSTSDKITENAGEGTDVAVSSVTISALAGNVEHLMLTGSAAINGTGNALANHLRGNSGNNALNGGAGNDVVQGAAGNDAVTDTSGNNVLDGGEGADTLTGGTGREFIAGGAGNDTLALGGGADLIAFNRGHGADTVNAPGSGTGLNETNDVISLGGARYDELLLSRSGNDLLLKIAGTSDSLKFAGWYAAAGNRTVSKLQVVVESTADYDPGSTDALLGNRVAWFDFNVVVGAFNAAYAANPAIGDWAVSSSTLRSALLGSSSAQAFGGDLAYRFGRDGDLGALDFSAATLVLGDANFATAPQNFGLATAPGGPGLLGDAPPVDIGAVVAALLAGPEPGRDDPILGNGEVTTAPDATQEGDTAPDAFGIGDALWPSAATAIGARVEAVRQSASSGFGQSERQAARLDDEDPGELSVAEDVSDELAPLDDLWVPPIIGSAMASAELAVVAVL